MARHENQKLKLLYLKEFLEQKTDEFHPATMPQILEYLQSRGVEAERKSIYSDLALLQDYGMDISLQKGPGGGYYLASREFELPELKLLVDAVLSSRFLTEKKSLELIGKLSTLCNVHEAGSLRRQVAVSGRVKNMNESIYYTVDRLHEAISGNHQIAFRYFDWGVDKRRHYRPNRYQASPYGLCWTNENYYLVAHSEPHGITHYRVDKMADLSICELPREFPPEQQTLDLADYSKKVFGMFGGQDAPVKLRFHRTLAGVVIDRFGKDAMLIPDGPEHFLYTAQVAVSPQFLSWLVGFGSQVQILYPEFVKEQLCALCRDALDQYE